MIENKLKELLSKSKMFKLQTILVLDYKGKKKIIHSSTILIASDSNIDNEFKAMHQSIMNKNEKLCLKTLDCPGCNYKIQY